MKRISSVEFCIVNTFVHLHVPLCYFPHPLIIVLLHILLLHIFYKPKLGRGVKYLPKGKITFSRKNNNNTQCTQHLTFYEKVIFSSLYMDDQIFLLLNISLHCLHSLYISTLVFPSGSLNLHLSSSPLLMICSSCGHTGSK